MTITEQQWLGNAGAPIDQALIDDLTAREAAALADMKRALRPFDRPRLEPKQGWEFPRAGVRRRDDGRWQLRIWLDARGLWDPIQGGACETRTEAFNLGAMLIQFARDAA